MSNNFHAGLHVKWQHTIQVQTLEWMVGGFCAIIGALMLIAPHQFAIPAFSALQPYLGWWGGSFLFIGAMLLIVTALALPGSVRWIARLGASATLLMLARGFWLIHGWTGVVVYGVLGLGLILSVFLPSRPHRPRATGYDLFALLIGLSSALNGLIILSSTNTFSGFLYNTMRWYIHINGFGFLLGGLALLSAYLLPRMPRPLFWMCHLLGAGGLWLFLATNAAPMRIWTGIAYYGGFGLAVAFLPWVNSALQRINPAALQVRLGLTLAVSAATPLIVAMTLLTNQQEQQAINQAVLVQQSVASTLAQDVQTYLRLHQSAVVLLASRPDLLTLPLEQQRSTLQVFNRAYPDFIDVELFDANGTAIVRRGERPLSPSVRGLALFEDARQLQKPVLEARMGRVLKRPLFIFSAPIVTPDGQFAGVVVAAIDTARVAQVLETVQLGTDATIFLVDGTGQLVAAPGALSEQIFADYAETPSVVALRSGSAMADTLRYRNYGGEQLASYAQLAEPGWGLVIERPTIAAIASIHAGRELAFAVLLVMIGAAVASGIVLARQLSSPLGKLAQAANQFATDEAVAPLPHSTIAEVANLTNIFRLMRDSLIQQTAERDHLYAAERSAREAAESAVRVRETFLAIASHELKTPLTSLIGQTQLLQRRLNRDGSLDLRVQRSLTAILEQARRLNQLISALLDMSRIQTEQLTIEFQPVDLAAVVRRVVAQVQPLLRQHIVTCEGAGGTLIISGDALRLEQALQNLLQNAIKYSPDGGSIIVRVEEQVGTVEISVSDQGIGIPATALPRLFTRFYRAENIDPYEISGLGIGLFIVKEIVTLHGGTVEVKSEEGCGSTFTICLPSCHNDMLLEKYVPPATNRSLSRSTSPWSKQR